MAQILRIDPVHQPDTVPFTGLLAKRVFEYAEAHQTDQDATGYTAAVMSGLWSGQRDGVLLVALVESNAIVGHVLAYKMGRYVDITQVRADQNVGDGLAQAIGLVESWAQAIGGAGVRIISHRNPKAFEKLGYVPTQTIAVKALQSDMRAVEPQLAGAARNGG